MNSQDLPAGIAASRIYLKPDGGEVTIRFRTPTHDADEDWWYCRWSIAGFEEDDEVSVNVPGPDSLAALISAMAMCGDKLEACQQEVGYRLEFLESTENRMLRTDVSGDFNGWSATIRNPRPAGRPQSSSGDCCGG